MAGDLPHAPHLTLKDLQGQAHSILIQGRLTVIIFWSAECPWSTRTDEIINIWEKEWGERVDVVRVSANSNEPLERIRETARERSLGRVVLDPNQQAVQLFMAKTTPHVFVVDMQGWIRYQGAVDDVTFRQKIPTRFYLKEAVDSILSGKKPGLVQTPPYGCTIS